MKKVVTLCMLVAVAVSVVTPCAEAIAPFKKAFQEKYVDPLENADFEAQFKKASCNTCHVKGKKKDVRNEYGDELAKLIEGDANKRIKDAGADGRKAMTAEILKELDKAFDKVAEMKAKDGETYGAKIKGGNLPVPLP